MKRHLPVGGIKNHDIYYDFPENLPNAETCLNILYQAFSGYAPARNYTAYCEQCFPRGWVERSITALSKDKRKVKAENFSFLYDEHPSCAGGSDNIKYWLPRAIELIFLRSDDITGLGQRCQQIGLSCWPYFELSALRAVFCRAALGWFKSGDPAPIGGVEEKSKLPHPGMTVSEMIVDMLVYTRIKSETVFSTLLNLDTSRVWHYFSDVLLNPQSFEVNVSFDRPEPHPERYAGKDYMSHEDTRTVMQVIQRRARHALFSVVTKDRLLHKWEEIADEAPDLGRAIECAVDVYDDAYFFMNEDAVKHDEQTLRTLLLAGGCL